MVREKEAEEFLGMEGFIEGLGQMTTEELVPSLPGMTTQQVVQICHRATGLIPKPNQLRHKTQSGQPDMITTANREKSKF